MSDTFAGAGSEAGIRVWRIEQFALVPDEQGSAAIFASQLDDALGGGAVQFRQQQGLESQEFTKLFPQLYYKPGGVKSGFRHVSLEPESPKLYQVKATSRTSVKIAEVPVALGSLSAGDSFVLDDPSSRTLFVWHGSGASIKEKARCLDAAGTLRSSSGMKMAVMEQDDVSSSEAKQFYHVLGSDDAAAAAGSIRAADDDAAASPAAMLQPPRLFKVEGVGKQLAEVAGSLSRSQLDPSAQMALAAAGSIWVWTGSKVPARAAAAAWAAGTQLASTLGLPPSTVVKCIKDRFEPGLFTTYFPDWSQAERLANAQGRNAGTGAVPGVQQQRQVDLQQVAASMLGAAGQPAMAAPAGAPEHQDGTLKVWVVHGNQLQQLPEGEQGEFYDADSYVVLFSYEVSRGELRHLVYFWLGRHSSNQEQGTAALLATNMHNEDYKGASALIRVVQNSEPAHFARLFRGSLVVHRGDRGAQPAGTRLYHVKALSPQATHAVEVDASATSLNSGDCFLLVAGPAVWLWQGRYSLDQERATAAAVASRLAGGAVVQQLQEGQEDGSFWQVLGGKADHPSFSPAHVAKPPTLFHILDSAGARAMKVEPCMEFSQDDLTDDDVFMLDTAQEVYVWFGKNCAASERKRGLDLATAYVDQAAQQQQGHGSVKVAIVEIESGKEPPFFTQHFPGWDTRQRAQLADVYLEKLKLLQVAE